MWNEPEHIVAFLNQTYAPDGWRLRYVQQLNDGYSGALLFLCQAEPGLHFVVVKSFRDSAAALSERENNDRAGRQFHLPGQNLTGVHVFPGDAGACFCMKLAGDGAGKPFSEIVKRAIETGDASLAVQLIELLRAKLCRVVPTPITKSAFTEVHFDENLHKQLQTLDNELYSQFCDWWEQKSQGEYRSVACAPAHGDLHTDNIFITNTDNPDEDDIHLIDFGCYGEHPILKDFARLERDIRFRLFNVSLNAGEDVVETYLRDQDEITELSLNEKTEPKKHLAIIAKLVRTVGDQARHLIGGDTSFEYDYIRLLEFIFFAASPLGNRQKQQRTAAFRAAMALAKRIDRHYEEASYVKDNAVLWRLGYAFLRLEQLPSGGWARSLPTWYQTLKGDTEEGRSRGFELRRIGGMNLTCVAMINYTRSICSVLGIESKGHLKGQENSDSFRRFLSELDRLERHNGVAQRATSYIQERINAEGAIPDQWERNPDTDVHHTLLGIIVLLLSYFYLAHRCEPSFYSSLKKMCRYLDDPGSRLIMQVGGQSTARKNEIYCALQFLRHLFEYDFLKTSDPGARRALNELQQTLVDIRSRVSDDDIADAYPDVEKNASGFLLNLPFLWDLDGKKLLEENPNFTELPLSRIDADADSLVQCTLAGKTVDCDWGHTAGYWWANTRCDKSELKSTPRVLQTLVAQLTNHRALSLTHGVSFSHVLGICNPPTPKELQELDKEVNEVLDSGATERNLLSLILWIYHQVYQDVPLLHKDLNGDRKLLESYPNGHKWLPIISEIKNLFVNKLQPGFYIPTKAQEELYKRWRAEIRKSLVTTKKFFDDPLSDYNTAANEQRLPSKKWFHLFNYLGEKPDSPDSWVLDIGCGSGAHAIMQFLPQGYKVHFYDYSRRILEQLKIRLDVGNFAPSQYMLTPGSIEELPARHKLSSAELKVPYRVIFADGVLFHIPKEMMPEILACFRELLSSDGLFFANFKINDHTLIGIDGRRFEYYGSHDEIQRMIEDAGFYVNEVTITKKIASMYGSPYPTQWAHFISSKR